MILKKLICIFVCFFFSGCCYNNSVERESHNNIMQSDSIEDITNEVLNNHSSYTSQNSAEVQIMQSNTDIDSSASVNIKTHELLPPNEFEKGKVTIQSIITPWTEEDICNAWNMTKLSKTFRTYLDRCFADLDNDRCPELFLTAHSSSQFFIAGFQKQNNKIIYLDTLAFSGLVARSRLGIPPTDKNILSSSNSVNICPEKKPYEIDIWDLNQTIDDRNMKIFSNDENCYFSGYGFSNGNALCWVMKLCIQSNKLICEKSYEWGYYGYGRPDFILQYKAFIDGTALNISEPDVNNFLAQLK